MGRSAFLVSLCAALFCTSACQKRAKAEAHAEQKVSPQVEKKAVSKKVKPNPTRIAKKGENLTEKEIFERVVSEPQISYVDADVEESDSYEPKENVNCHDKKALDPSRCDRLAAIIIKAPSGKNLIARWDPKTLPVKFVFDSSVGSPEKNMWMEVIDHYNEVAREEDLVANGNNLVEISQSSENTLRFDQKPQDPNTGGETFLKIHSQTGQILHADIALYANNLKHFMALYAVRYGLPDSYERDALKFVAMHEMGHALGLDHNHVGHLYQTVMTSPPKMAHIDDDYYFPTAFGKNYDRSVLNYIYNEAYPQGQKVYPFWVYRDPR